MEIDSTEFHGLKLLTHCGCGAYGDVFYCEDISGRRMAVKIVSKAKIGDSWFRELKGVINYRKITEDSPELLQIFHVEEDEKYFFYTMEAADSVSKQEYKPDTLASRLNRGPLLQDEIFCVLSAILAGIKAIHDAGFAHRDIKPDNILFVKGVPKLGDIGLISSLTGTTTNLAGTIEFLPPEVRTADGSDSSSRKSTQKNDLYAFGKVIYCAVTGQEPHAWPTIPKELPLTLPFKLFLRLSLRLCDKDPARRINSISELEKELSDIKRKLETGETLRDKAAYQLKQFLIDLRCAGIHVASFIRNHWLLSVIVLALATGAAWFVYSEVQAVLARQEVVPQTVDRGEQETSRQETSKQETSKQETSKQETSKQETKLYINSELGVTMTVPFQWDIVSKETIAKLVRERRDKTPDLTEDERKRIDLFLSEYQSGVDTIYMDYETRPQDKITFTEKSKYRALFEMSVDEIILQSRAGMKQAVDYDVEIYEAQKTTFQGYPCLYLDYSISPNFRIIGYVINVDGRLISISLGCNMSRYAVRREQFTQVLQTVKFRKK